jgi:hypothetical protein
MSGSRQGETTSAAGGTWSWAERRRLARRRRQLDAAPWRGPNRRYDILKEATVAFVVILFATVILAVLFSSPDVPPVTVKAWATAQPKGFTEIALSELDGTSNSATYGPPYNHADNPNTDSVQYLGPVSIQKLLGVHYPLDPARAFVLRPLSVLPPTPSLTEALKRYESAPKAEQLAWDDAYAKALKTARVEDGRVVTASGHFGPVPVLLDHLLTMARSGALDAQLLSHSSFYTTNYTKPILFIGDSWKAQHAKSYWGEIVAAQHLKGSQWGVMNETGSWPGQPWLWFYTMWYQIPPMSTSGNGDVEVVVITSVFTLALMFAPFIPGLRDIPRWIPLHRVIWRDYYREAAKRRAASGSGSGSGGSAVPKGGGGSPPSAT